MPKFGERFVEDMIDRGRREAGSVMFADSNIAQPMYPLRSGYEASTPSADQQGPTLAERLEANAPDFNGPDVNDRDRGIEQE
jgi:hypothetical protein